MSFEVFRSRQSTILKAAEPFGHAAWIVDIDFRFMCFVMATGKVTNTLTITADSQKLGVDLSQHVLLSEIKHY